MRFVPVVLALLASVLVSRTAYAQAIASGWHGLKVERVTPLRRQEWNLPVAFGAVVTQIEEGSPAADADLRRHDVIISVNDIPVVSDVEFQAAMQPLSAGASVTLDLLRDSQKRTVSLTLGARTGPAVVRLRLDTGGHMSFIKSVLFTPDGEQLVSAGDDKVIRVWDWRKQQPIRTISGNAGTAEEGRISSLALSPDGRWLAASGNMRAFGETFHAIRLFEFGTGQLVGLLRGHTEPVSSLQFTPDAGSLVSASVDKTAIVWDVSSRKPRLHLVHEAAVRDVAVSPDGGWVVTASDDHLLRKWRLADGAPLTVLQGHRDKVTRVTVSPDGSKIASGSRMAPDSHDGEIWLWDAQADTAVRNWRQKGSNPGALTFSPDSAWLMSGAGSYGPDTKVYIWNANTAAEHIVFSLHDNNVIATTISPDGRWAATAGGDNHEIRVWELLRGEAGEIKEMRGVGSGVWAVGFSPDGKQIAWGQTAKKKWTQNDYGELRQVLRLPESGVELGKPEYLPSAEAGAFLKERNSHGVWSLSHGPGGNWGYDNAALLILREGELVETITRGRADGFAHTSYSFTFDGRAIVSGGSAGILFTYGLDGKALGPFIGHEDAVWSVSTSPDGRFLLSGSVDQTVRLWNLRTRELIVTLFHGTDGEWVMWTPQGYYTGSARAGRIVGWQINNGPEAEADYVTATQIRDRLLRPDIVERAIILASADAAVREAGLDPAGVEAMLLAQRPPIIQVSAPKVAFGGRATVAVTVAKGLPSIDHLDVLVVDSKGQAARVNPSPGDDAPPGALGVGDRKFVRAYEIPLFAGTNEVRVVAVNAGGESAPIKMAVEHTGEGALDKRNRLWILAVGVDKYPGARISYDDLRFAEKDATTFASVAAHRLGGTHRDSDVTILVGGKDRKKSPSRANILGALARIAKNAGPNDTVALFLAGHGENWAGGRYHFLPSDFARKAKTRKGANVIDWASDIQPRFNKIQGRRMIFLDACHAASARNRTLQAEAAASSFTAFQASSSDKKAWEFEEEGHGYFTFFLMEGIKGASDAVDPIEKAVTVYKLGPYVQQMVRRLTNGSQAPEFLAGQGDFVLTRP